MNKKSGKIFPHSIVRISTLKSNTVSEFRSKSSIDIDSIHKAYIDTKKASSALEYKILKLAKSTQKPSKFFEIRRLLHNSKYSKSLSLIKKYDTSNTFTLESSKLKEHHSKFEKLKNQYIQETTPQTLLESSVNILIKNPTLANGIIFSSVETYKQLTKNRKKTKPRDAIKTATTVYKYATRSAFKTSPFSTFTTFGCVSHINNFGKFISTDKLNLKNHYSINLVNKGRVMSALANNDLTKRNLPLVINPTIIQIKNNYHYYTRENTNDKLSTLKNTHTIRTIKKTISNSKENISISELSGELLTLPHSGDEKEISAYIHKLVEIDFLRFSKLTNPIDKEWIQSLHKIIKKTKTSSLNSQFTPLLNSLSEQLNTLKNNSENNKPHTIESIQEILDKLTFILNNPNNKDNSLKNASLCVKNDCSTTIPNTLNNKPLEDVLPTISNIANILKAAHQNQLYQSEFETTLKSLYKNNISLTELFEEYHRNASNPRSNAKTKPSSRFTDSLDLHFNQDEVQIDTFSTRAKIREKTNTTPTTIIYMPLNGPNGFAIYLTAIANTFGGPIARFLKYFPKEISDKLRESNSTTTEENTLRAYLSDDSLFNASIAPPLLNHCIDFSHSDERLPPNNRINFKNLIVHNENDKLVLFDKERKKKIEAHYLDLLAISHRSKILQFTRKAFSPYQPHIFELINAIDLKWRSDDKHKLHKNPDIKFYPRITADNKVFLARKTWIIPRSIIPKKEKLDLPEYQIHVDRWRRSLNIPKEVFITFWNKEGRRGLGPAKEDAPTDSKPLYINFSYPIASIFFSKSALEANSEITIEEILPAQSERISGCKSRSTEIMSIVNI